MKLAFLVALAVGVTAFPMGASWPPVDWSCDPPDIGFKAVP